MRSVFTHLLWIETISKIGGFLEEDPKWRSYRYILLQTKTHIMMIIQHTYV